MTDNIIYSQLYFCNSALLSLGSDSIASLDDNRLEAKIAKQLYPIVLGDLLTRHAWRFLIKNGVTLPAVATPIATWQTLYPKHNQYQLPDNFLMMLTPLGGTRNDYILADNILLSKNQQPVIDCLLKIDEQFFPIYFAKLLVDYLTAEMALPITEDISRAQFLLGKAANEYKNARAQDNGLTATAPIAARYPLIEKR
ncbi:MAG: hypothetical protein QM529_07160 [Hydrotalea sp.]|nr:hypothetical protein [Hydrotalea sp.]